ADGEALPARHCGRVRCVNTLHEADMTDSSGDPKAFEQREAETRDAESDPAPAPDRAEGAPETPAPADLGDLDRAATQEEFEKPRTPGDLIAELCECRRRCTEAAK